MAAKGQEAGLASQQRKQGKATALCIEVLQRTAAQLSLYCGGDTFSPSAAKAEQHQKREILPMAGFAFPDRTQFV